MEAQTKLKLNVLVAGGQVQDRLVFCFYVALT